jgi:hypothetical protein
MLGEGLARGFSIIEVLQLHHDIRKRVQRGPRGIVNNARMYWS